MCLPDPSPPPGKSSVTRQVKNREFNEVSFFSFLPRCCYEISPLSFRGNSFSAHAQGQKKFSFQSTNINHMRVKKPVGHCVAGMRSPTELVPSEQFLASFVCSGAAVHEGERKPVKALQTLQNLASGWLSASLTICNLPVDASLGAVSGGCSLGYPNSRAELVGS